MNTNRTEEKKQPWAKLQVIAQVIIAFAGLVFTILFGIMQQRNADATVKLAKSNIELSKSQVQVSLLPALSNEDACQRVMALFLARNLDENFALEAARALLVGDRDETVREKARLILGIFSQSQDIQLKERAIKAVQEYDVLSELRAYGFIKKLSEARGYLDGGHPDGIEKALQIYNEIIDHLSPGVLKNFDRALLMDAKEDERQNYKELAARKYRALFQEYGV